MQQESVFYAIQGFRGISGGWGTGATPFSFFWFPRLHCACPGLADVHLLCGVVKQSGEIVAHCPVHPILQSLLGFCGNQCLVHFPAI